MKSEIANQPSSGGGFQPVWQKKIGKGLIALKPGYDANESLRRELLAHARRRLGPAVAPRAIGFQNELPRTRSGKILRRLLRDRELGRPPQQLIGIRLPRSTKLPPPAQRQPQNQPSRAGSR